MKRLAVIDGKSVFYRGYYSMPNLSTRDGTPTGGVYGFTSLALELIKKLQPDYVVVAWDKKGTSIRRRLEILPTYKEGRKTPPEDFIAQIPMLHELLQAFDWPLYECDDYEADDIMGTLARQADGQGIETYLITSDLDMLQLIGPHTHVYALKKGLSSIEEFNVGYFEDKYGISVKQYTDLKALKGDSSDNIPGVPGIGEKTAIKLLQDYGTLDGIYEHLDEITPSVAKKLEAGKDSAYMSRTVAEIWCDAPVAFDPKAMDASEFDTARLAGLLRKLEFTSLLRRLPAHMQQSPQGSLFAGNTSSVEPLSEVAWPEALDLGDDSAVTLQIADEKVWLSWNTKTVASLPIGDVKEELWRSLEKARVIAYDTKDLYHQLNKYGISVHFENAYDVCQAAFLLDSLQRDRSLAGLIGGDLNEADPHESLAALWQIYQRQQQAFAKEPRIRWVAEELDFPLAYLLFRMEARGVKIDSDKLKAMSEELGTQHAKLEQEMFDMVGYEFNIGSPAQLSDVLFTKLQLSTVGIKKGKTSYSTGQSELDKLRGQHPIIELIEQTRELAKLKNTYVDTLPKLADEHGRVHTTFNQDVASTGRLSSTNPNLQNIPIRSELGRKIREAFVAEKGNVLVSADYSQFELRLAAVLAGDEELIHDFNGDVDIHTKTASEVYGVAMEDVTKNQRRAAKVVNFGVLYGMSPHGLAAAAGMTFGEAKHFITQYFRLRAPIRAFIDTTLKKAETDGYVETYFGRRRPTPDAKSSNFVVREAARRAAANMPIQGTEADLMKMAMLKVEDQLDGLGEQILQIHDSILVETPKDNADKVGDILKSTMESIYPDLKVKLKVDVSTGENWGEL
jgi:DNA polymerase-1